MENLQQSFYLGSYLDKRIFSQSMIFRASRE